MDESEALHRIMGLGSRKSEIMLAIPTASILYYRLD